jgi:aldehyde oxidoreductase
MRLAGAQVCACITPVGQCEAQEIVTVEGLARDAFGANLQAAFHACGAAQCSIYTPGMLMAAHGLLMRNARPTQREIEVGLAGVLCRCTGYQEIIEAAQICAAGISADHQADLRHIGGRLPKVDGIAKLTGSEIFGADGIP